MRMSTIDPFGFCTELAFSQIWVLLHGLDGPDKLIDVDTVHHMDCLLHHDFSPSTIRLDFSYGGLRDTLQRNITVAKYLSGRTTCVKVESFLRRQRRDFIFLLNGRP